ncbi:hypothetical protein FJV83_24350 [Mesorhizobium sp. WSM4307]|uniref:hypothetical protein n=1 Tax=unclassified Mesorhizobium TaxID=325217 RepID=UPI00115D34A0|nr:MULTISPECIES: hypothetical protein [unclassified Mesorhizobium]TRC76857.1 hypothetical protein FJV81_14610 [Mesorhizobium sp. WSM4315]TRC81310.1 hypothetical protein FJV83_24350 [Mesorhizobium sp. WSM4307]
MRFVPPFAEKGDACKPLEQFQEKCERFPLGIAPKQQLRAARRFRETGEPLEAKRREIRDGWVRFAKKGRPTHRIGRPLGLASRLEATYAAAFA